MKITIPRRDTILGQIVLSCEIKPLARPRASFHTKGIYQPLKNQEALFAALKAVHPLYIDQACFVDIAITFAMSKSYAHSFGKGRASPHPITKQRGDVDNLAKAINDGLVRYKILADDYYIVGQSITKTFGKEDLCLIEIWSAEAQTSEVEAWNLSSGPIKQKPADKLLGIF